MNDIERMLSRGPTPCNPASVATLAAATRMAWGRASRRALAELVRALRLGMLLLHDLGTTLATPRPRRQRDSLVLRTDGIGDCILWLDAAKELRRVGRLSGKIVLLASRPADELLRGLPYFDEVWPLDRRRMRADLAYRRAVLRRVRRRGFAVVLNPVSARDPAIEDALVRASGASVRIGIAGDLAIARRWEQRFSNTAYTELQSAAGSGMELRRAASFMVQLGVPYAPGPPKLPRLAASSPSTLPPRYYVLFPGAGWSSKAWPAAAFKALARRIRAETGLPGVVCGGPAEAARTAAVVAGDEDWLFDLGGRTSLQQLAAVLARAAFLVANDTSAVHIAAAMGVPAVALLGGGHFGRFLPYDSDRPRPSDPLVVYAPMACFGCGWQCVFPIAAEAPYPCIAAISVDAVWEKVAAALAAAAPAPRSSAGTVLPAVG